MIPILKIRDADGSLIDNNVWTPDAYPSGWELTKEN